MKNKNKWIDENDVVEMVGEIQRNSGIVITIKGAKEKVGQKEKAGEEARKRVIPEDREDRGFEKEPESGRRQRVNLEKTDKKLEDFTLTDEDWEVIDKEFVEIKQYTSGAGERLSRLRKLRGGIKDRIRDNPEKADLVGGLKAALEGLDEEEGKILSSLSEAERRQAECEVLLFDLSESGVEFPELFARAIALGVVRETERNRGPNRFFVRQKNYEVVGDERTGVIPQLHQGIAAKLWKLQKEYEKKAEERMKESRSNEIEQMRRQGTVELLKAVTQATVPLGKSYGYLPMKVKTDGRQDGRILKRYPELHELHFLVKIATRKVGKTEIPVVLPQKAIGQPEIEAMFQSLCEKGVYLTVNSLKRDFNVSEGVVNWLGEEGVKDLKWFWSILRKALFYQMDQKQLVEKIKEGEAEVEQVPLH